MSTCQDCGAPVAGSKRCDDCLDKWMTERNREVLFAQIEREGFDVVGWEPEGSTCMRRTEKQVSPRKRVTEPCGNKATVSLNFRAPSNPEGVLVPLCRNCLVKFITRDLMLYLED